MRTAATLTVLAASGLLAAAGGCQSTSSAGPSARTEAFDPIVAFKPGLRAELLDMRQQDQALRGKISQTPASERRELFVQILDRNDDNVERLEAIIDRYGWPTISMVGKDGAEAAWLIAQHADQRPDFRERCLALMQRAAASGEASKAHLAYLVDRVMVEVSQQQFYGTQFWDGPDGYGPVPLIDAENVNERRQAAGLVSMQEYTLAMTARRPGAALSESAVASAQGERPNEGSDGEATASANPDD